MKVQLLLWRRTRSLRIWATTAPNVEELLDPRDNQEGKLNWTLWKPMGEPITIIINIAT